MGECLLNINDSQNKNILVFVVVSFLICLDTLFLIFQQDSVYLLIAFFVYLVSIITLESLLLLFLGHYRRYAWAIKLLTAGFIAINLISFKISYNAEMLTWARPNKILFAIICVGVVYLFLSQKWFLKKRILIIVSVCMIAFSIIGIISFGEANIEKKVGFGYDEVSLADTPNIHLISFDSMIPNAIAQKYLDTSVAYQDFLDNHMIAFQNSFSHAIPTAPSLNAVLKLDDDRLPKLGFFSGKLLSPLVAILKNNHYDITMGNANYYFGKKGSFIDKYQVSSTHISSFKDSSLCLGMHSRFLFIPKSFYICDLISTIFPMGTDNDTVLWPHQVMKTIEHLPTKASNFTFHYIFTPIGHTSNSFDHTNKVAYNQYLTHFNEQTKTLEALLYELQAMIMQTNPKAIVLVFGDHGTYLSRSDSYSKDPAFYIQDRHAISLSLMQTNHQCADKERVSTYIQNSFATPSKIMAGILRCLAQQPSQIDEVVHFSKKFEDDFLQYKYE